MVEKNNEKSRSIAKIAIGVGILVILLIIPFTRATIGVLGSYVGGLLLWIIGLFVLVIVIKWLVGKMYGKK